MELPPAVEPLWNIRQASEWLSMSERALRCMLQRNQIPKDVIIRIGRRIRFRAAPLRAWIERGSST
jgi:predicted DNA-binding transcriptional regulator AlpA